MKPKGVADGQQVNIPVPALLRCGDEGVKVPRTYGCALKLVDIGMVGKSANPVESDSTANPRVSG